MKRQIILDTETTGIGHGHRLVEIGCVELIDRRLTGRHFHRYLNPERLVDEGAFKVHGLSDTFLADKPLFSEIAEAFLEFVTDTEVIIHNATFDVGFINNEFSRLKKRGCLADYCQITDTLVLAREKHPGQRNSLDALCKRYQIDASDRVLHGALLDAQLLADVYLAMTSGQKKLEFEDVQHTTSSTFDLNCPYIVLKADADELKAHAKIIAAMAAKTGQNLW
jgi:DNA polymerase-3 subunit epsilon